MKHRLDPVLPVPDPVTPLSDNFLTFLAFPLIFFFSSDTIEITSFTNEDFQKQHSNELASSPFHY